MWLQLGFWVAELGGRTPGVADEKCNVEEGNGLHRRNSALIRLFLLFRRDYLEHIDCDVDAIVSQVLVDIG